MIDLNDLGLFYSHSATSLSVTSTLTQLIASEPVSLTSAFVVVGVLLKVNGRSSLTVWLSTGLSNRNKSYYGGRSESEPMASAFTTVSELGGLE